MSTVTAGSGQSPVVSYITYDPSSHVTALTLGSSDSDSFTFDPNTGRMTQYQYSVGSSPQTDTATLRWNPNGSLQQLAITDQLNPSDSQTCNYTHDALGRVASANCGASTWSQTFSYDPFGNIMKDVPQGSTGLTFLPSYDYTNNTNRIISSPFTYNGNNGDMATDNSHTYSWDTENKLTGIDSGTSNGICQTYDALGRVVEQDKGSTCSTSSTEIVYDPTGAKLALMNGSSLVKAFVSLPGGAQAVYTSSGLLYYRHPDWLGSSRLGSTSSQNLYYSGAYAPFGENYVPSGTQDLSFTGQNQDTESSGSGGVGGLYDFLYREHSPVQGRWLSLDPSGLAAVDPSDPQSWNRYSYVGNRPLNTIDSLGLYWPGYPGDCFSNPYDSTCAGGISLGGLQFGCIVFCYPIWLPNYPLISGGGGGGGFAPGDEGSAPSGAPNGLLGLGSLAGLLPGLNCGDFVSCDSFAPSTPSPSPSNQPSWWQNFLDFWRQIFSSDPEPQYAPGTCKDSPQVNGLCQQNNEQFVEGWYCEGGNNSIDCCITKLEAFASRCKERNKTTGGKYVVQESTSLPMQAACCRKE
jgi:RHS repeat-associated protein